MSKKLLSVMLTVCMLLSMFPVALPVAAEDEMQEDTLTDSVIEIGNADALVALMGDTSGWSGNYKLTADIDLTGKTQTSIGTAV